MLGPVGLKVAMAPDQFSTLFMVPVNDAVAGVVTVVAIA